MEKKLYVVLDGFTSSTSHWPTGHKTHTHRGPSHLSTRVPQLTRRLTVPFFSIEMPHWAALSDKPAEVTVAATHKSGVAETW